MTNNHGRILVLIPASMTLAVDPQAETCPNPVVSSSYLRSKRQSEYNDGQSPSQRPIVN